LRPVITEASIKISSVRDSKDLDDIQNVISDILGKATVTTSIVNNTYINYIEQVEKILERSSGVDTPRSVDVGSLAQTSFPELSTDLGTPQNLLKKEPVPKAVLSPSKAIQRSTHTHTYIGPSFDEYGAPMASTGDAGRKSDVTTVGIAKNEWKKQQSSSVRRQSDDWKSRSAYAFTQQTLLQRSFAEVGQVALSKELDPSYSRSMSVSTPEFFEGGVSEYSKSYINIYNKYNKDIVPSTLPSILPFREQELETRDGWPISSKTLMAASQTPSFYNRHDLGTVATAPVVGYLADPVVHTSGTYPRKTVVDRRIAASIHEQPFDELGEDILSTGLDSFPAQKQFLSPVAPVTPLFERVLEGLENDSVPRRRQLTQDIEILEASLEGGGTIERIFLHRKGDTVTEEVGFSQDTLPNNTQPQINKTKKFTGISVKPQEPTAVVTKLEYDLKYKAALQRLLYKKLHWKSPPIEQQIIGFPITKYGVSDLLGSIPLDGAIALSGPVPDVLDPLASYFNSGGNILGDDKEKKAGEGALEMLLTERTKTAAEKEARDIANKGIDIDAQIIGSGNKDPWDRLTKDTIDIKKHLVARKGAKFTQEDAKEFTSIAKQSARAVINTANQGGDIRQSKKEHDTKIESRIVAMYAHNNGINVQSGENGQFELADIKNQVSEDEFSLISDTVNELSVSGVHESDKQTAKVSKAIANKTEEPLARSEPVQPSKASKVIADKQQKATFSDRLASSANSVTNLRDSGATEAADKAELQHNRAAEAAVIRRETKKLGVDQSLVHDVDGNESLQVADLKGVVTDKELSNIEKKVKESTVEGQIAKDASSKEREVELSNIEKTSEVLSKGDAGEKTDARILKNIEETARQYPKADRSIVVERSIKNELTRQSSGSIPSEKEVARFKKDFEKRHDGLKLTDKELAKDIKYESGHGPNIATMEQRLQMIEQTLTRLMRDV